MRQVSAALRRVATALSVWIGDGRNALLLLAFAVCGGLLIANALSYLPFFADDGFISLRYADRLLHGHGLTWSDSERVEGYSNLSWVLGCALLGLLHIDLVLAARLLGIGSALAAMAALARSVRPDLSAPRAALAFAAGALVLASSGPVAVWSIGGLEQPLVAALLLWGVVEAGRLPSLGRVSWRMLLPSGLSLGWLAWTRPDGALLGLCTAAGLGVAQLAWGEGNRTRWAKTALGALKLAAFPLAFALVQLAFRLVYYGAWLPNTALAKLAFTSERLQEGWRYLVLASSVHINLVALAAAAIFPLVLDRAARRRLVVAAVPLLAWVGYVVVIGGDIFPARRHFVPVVALLALFVVEAMAWAARRPLPWRAVAAAGAFVTIVFGALRQTGDPELHRALRERWEWDGEPIGALLQRHFTDRSALLAADSAGTLPYFSRLPSIDLLGLNDKTMARNRPAGFGHGPLGHELGDGASVMAREPDLVVFGLPTGEAHALYRSGLEMQRDPRFGKEYTLITFEARGDISVRSRIWVRRRGNVGITRHGATVEVPGYLLATQPSVVAAEDSDGRLGAVLTPLGAGRVNGILLEGGEWIAEADFTGPAPRLTVRVNEVEIASGEPGLTFTLASGSQTVVIDAQSDGTSLTHVRALRLRLARHE